MSSQNYEESGYFFDLDSLTIYHTPIDRTFKFAIKCEDIKFV